MKRFSVLFAACAVVALPACEGLKEAMTAHVDTVARAGSQELTVDRMVKLLGEAKVPPRKDVATAIANAWLDYQLLGEAAAKGDTTVSTPALDSAMWAMEAGLKARKYYDSVSKTWGGDDTAGARQMYANGDVLAASHILFLTRGQPDSVKATAKRKAEALRKQLTSGNFAEMAKKNSQDPGSAPRGGSLGLFRKGMMVPQFEQALLALKPGEISPVIETEFGYHIIRRSTYAEVKDQLSQVSKGKAMQHAESAFVANLEQNGKIQIRPDAPATARAVLSAPDAHAKDGTTLATSTAGTFTAGRLAQWLQTLPAIALQQQQERMQGAPDSTVTGFVKQFVINELVLRAADNARITPTPQELQQLRTGFITSRDMAWVQLGVDPKVLAAGAKTEAERERFAAAHIDAYMDKLVAGQAQFVQVAPPLSRMLRDHANASINDVGLQHAVERAVKTYSAADSAHRAAQPPSVVPMPGEPSAGPPAGQPQPRSARP